MAYSEDKTAKSVKLIGLALIIVGYFAYWYSEMPKRN